MISTVEQRYCPKCHKMFAYELLVQVDKWCPNCYNGYQYHNDLVDIPDDYLKQIELKRLD